MPRYTFRFKPKLGKLRHTTYLSGGKSTATSSGGPGGGGGGTKMAASRLYYNPETKLTFKGSGGDVLLTFASTADQALAVSAQKDRGVGALPDLYRWRIKTQINAAGTIGKQVRIYLIQTNDATDIPGRVGTSDTEIASAADRVRNLGAPIGAAVADVTTLGTDFIATGMAFIYDRFFSVGIFNDMGVALHATESVHYFEITPIPPESQ